MSVIMTLRMSVDAEVWERTAAEHAEAIGRVMEIAKSHGLIGHRWYGRDGEVMAADEWPAPENFQAFFEEAQPQIGPLMEAAGITSQPDVTFWQQLDIDDAYGWGA